MKTKGSRRRQEILIQAKKMIAVLGYEKTSFQKIADRLQVSQSAVLYHFKNKKQLFQGVLELMITESAQIEQELTTGKIETLEQELELFFRKNYRWAIEYDFNAQVMTQLIQFASFDPFFQEVYTSWTDLAKQNLAGILGKHHSQYEDMLIIETLHDSLLGFLLVASATEKKPDDKNNQLNKWRRLTQAICP